MEGERSRAAVYHSFPRFDLQDTKCDRNMVCRPVSMKKSAGFHSCRQVHWQVVTVTLGVCARIALIIIFFQKTLQNGDSFWVTSVDKSDLSVQINACPEAGKTPVVF